MLVLRYLTRIPALYIVIVCSHQPTHTCHPQKVDLSYDPGVLHLDASFTVHSSMGSILHELNCDRPMPLMTTTTVGNHVGNGGNDDIDGRVCGKGVDIQTENYLEDDKRSAESEAISNEDEDSCTLSPITRGEHYSNNDSNSSSEGSRVSSFRQSSVSTSTAVSTGYVTELPSSHNSESAASNTKHAVQRAEENNEEEIPVFILHNEEPVDLPSKGMAGSSTKGYIYSTDPRFTSPGASGVDSSPTPTENRSLESDFTTDSKTVSQALGALTTNTAQPQQKQKQEQQPQNHQQRQPSQEEYQKSVSELSLNVITDIEQAFPRFASGESLYLPSYPTFDAPMHARFPSQTDIHSLNTTVQPSSDYPPQPSISHALVEHNTPSSATRIKFSTTTSKLPLPRAGKRITDTLHLYSTHTFSGTEDINATLHTQEHYTPDSEGRDGKKSTSSLLTKNTTEHETRETLTAKNTAPETRDSFATSDSLTRDPIHVTRVTSATLGGDTPCSSDYINLEEAALLGGDAAEGECKTLTDPIDLCRETLISDSFGGDTETKEQFESSNSPSCLLSSTEMDSGTACGTHVEKSHLHHRTVRGSQLQEPFSEIMNSRGFRNVLFSLDSDSD